MSAKKVKDVCVNLSTWDFEGELGELAERINQLIKQYGADAVVSYGQYDRWDDGYSFQLTKMRDETAEERKFRLAKERADEMVREEFEREQLRKLTAKYGKPVDN